MRLAWCRWELVALTRRTLLVVADVALFLDARWKFGAFALLNLLFLVMHIVNGPYRHRNENLLETALLTLLVGIGILLSVDPPSSAPGTEIALLCLVLLPVLALAFLLLTKRVVIAGPVSADRGPASCDSVVLN